MRMHFISLSRFLQEANSTFFPTGEIRIELLKNCPEMIPTLAEWEYQNWHRYDTSLTVEKLISGFHRLLNGDRLPFALVVLKGATPLGIISLGDKSEPELSDLEDGSPWGGSFHLIPDERGRGLGKKLGHILIYLARRLGYEKLHFYTSNPRVANWYIKQGAHLVETRPYRGHTITIMEYAL